MRYDNRREYEFDLAVEAIEKEASRKNLLKKIEELKERAFLINMTDRWTWEDRKNLEDIERQIKEINLKLA